MNDPKPYSFSVRTAQGTAKIAKESEDGVVSGLQFRVTGNGIDKTYTTDSKGQITDTLPAGTYTVTEVNTPGRYNTPASQSITVPDGGTATVTFSNTLKKGYVEIYKSDTTTGGPLAGAVLRHLQQRGHPDRGTQNQRGRLRQERPAPLWGRLLFVRGKSPGGVCAGYYQALLQRAHE